MNERFSPRDAEKIAGIREKLSDPALSPADRAYYARMLRVLEMPDLSRTPGHPIERIVRMVAESEAYAGFEHPEIPEIVAEWETFDLFNFPTSHVARRRSDSYFLEKSEDTKKSLLLRPHTSVMWYHFLVEGGGREKLEREGEVKALAWGKVYRVDELDKTHHECFHQIDGLRIVAKERETVDQSTLRTVLSEMIEAIFGTNVPYRFNPDSFPYTTDSLEAEVFHNGRWLEVNGAGVVHPDVLERLGIDPERYGGWAFGFGIERVAMPLRNIPDIRIFWSEDPRVTKQWEGLAPYREVSSYPPVYKDVSMVVPKDRFVRDLVEEVKSGELELTRETESDFFAVTGIIRDIGKDLVEEVKIVEIYENDAKFGPHRKSLCVRIVFRSIERTLTHEEINRAYFEIRAAIGEGLGYEVR